MPKAIESFVLRFGMSKVDSSVDISLLLAENKKIIDTMAKRLYFVQNPVALKIKNHEIENINIRLHPSDESMGMRLVTVGGTVYIANDDADLLQVGDVVKLKELFAVKIVNINKDDKSIECEIVQNPNPEKKIQWVSNRDKVETYIQVPKDISKKDGSFILDSLEVVNGYGESYINRLFDMEIIQFERFGFCSAHISDKGNYFIFISK
jgi:glutamyl/glutaminyl-tRNA synthetase